MCPLCNTCKAWNMSEICTMAKVNPPSAAAAPATSVLRAQLATQKEQKAFTSPPPRGQMGYLFDHPGTVFFSVFMSFWAVTFLEYWKRKMATLAHHWDCMDFHEEEVLHPSH